MTGKPLSLGKGAAGNVGRVTRQRREWQTASGSHLRLALHPLPG